MPTLFKYRARVQNTNIQQQIIEGVANTQEDTKLANKLRHTAKLIKTLKEKYYDEPDKVNPKLDFIVRKLTGYSRTINIEICENILDEIRVNVEL